MKAFNITTPKISAPKMDLTKAFKYVFTWQWTKQLLYWLIFSAGTMSECAFLIASVWMSINSSVHQLVHLFMPDSIAINISTFASAAYVALPEMIVGLACLTVIAHGRTFLYTKDYRAAIWTTLFFLPTLIFIGLSIFTLANSVQNTSYTVPTFWVVTRALAGYSYAFLSLIYAEIGKAQEADRLADKDRTIEQMGEERDVLCETFEQEKNIMIETFEQEAETLNEQINLLTAELNQQKTILAQHKKQNEDLQKAALETANTALQAYSPECIDWLNSGIKTATVEEINHYTGHSKRKLTYAMVNGKLQTATRNKELIVVSSLIEWLKDNPPAVVRNTDPMFKIVEG